MNPIETITGAPGLYAHIYQDEDPCNPREDDNMGRITTVRLARYTLADKGEDPLPENLSGWAEVEAYLRRERSAFLILPLFMYDHSGIRISTSSFIGRAHHAEWDSGQVGFVYATRKDILDNFMVKRMTPDILKRAEDNLRGEVETMNQYLASDVYRYEIIRSRKCSACKHVEAETVDSCGGFFGYETVKNEATSALEAAAKEK